jgi:hypothetical protein
LSTVFQFVGAHELENEVAELVAIHKNDAGFVCSPVDISSGMRPTYILGRTPRTEAETLSWLQNPQRTVFCFPAKTVGPDLMLFLRLSDNSIIRVLVQFKHENQNAMGPRDTADAFRTTDPNWFISCLAESSPVIGDKALPGRKIMPRGEPYVPLLVSKTTSHRLHLVAHNPAKPT